MKNVFFRQDKMFDADLGFTYVKSKAGCGRIRERENVSGPFLCPALVLTGADMEDVSLREERRILFFTGSAMTSAVSAHNGGEEACFLCLLRA